MDEKRVREYLDLRDKGFSASKIAAAYGLTKSTVTSAISKYKHRPKPTIIKRFPGEEGQ